MASDNLTVNGRRFRTKTDYEAAMRDKHKIEVIRSRVNFCVPKEVYELYNAMQSGAYRFETMVGNDFDDEVYELVEKYKSEGISPETGKKPGRKESKIAEKKAKQEKQAAKDKKYDDKMKEKAGKQQVGFQDFSEDMQKIILAELKKREKRRRLLVICSGILAFGCFAYFGIYYFFAERTTADYEQLASLKNDSSYAGLPVDTSLVHRTGDVELPDILEEYKTLFNKNKKLIGWVKIDDTNIDYPVMQTTNNEYYLTYNFNQEYDKNGSIFMDCNCVAYPQSTNTILYGHHMKSGKMFGQLQSYAKESFYEDHKIIQFDTIYEKGTYEIMYVFRSKVFNENEIVFKYYQFIDAYSEKEFNSYMLEMAEQSLYDTGVTAKYGDKLLTLSTCDNSQEDGRFVVVAKKQ